MFQITSKI